MEQDGNNVIPIDRNVNFYLTKIVSQGDMRISRNASGYCVSFMAYRSFSGGRAIAPSLIQAFEILYNKYCKEK